MCFPIKVLINQFKQRNSRIKVILVRSRRVCECGRVSFSTSSRVDGVKGNWEGDGDHNPNKQDKQSTAELQHNEVMVQFKRAANTPTKAGRASLHWRDRGEQKEGF